MNEKVSAKSFSYTKNIAKEWNPEEYQSYDEGDPPQKCEI
jgi:hypothetical protein